MREYELIIAITKDEEGEALGDLFWKRGEVCLQDQVSGRVKFAQLTSAQFPKGLFLDEKEKKCFRKLKGGRL